MITALPFTLRRFGIPLISLTLCALLHATGMASQFKITLSPEMGGNSISGRLLLVFTKDHEREPRFLLDQAEEIEPFILGRDVDGISPEKPLQLDDSLPGTRKIRLSEIP